MIDKNTLCSMMLRRKLSTKALAELSGVPEDTIKNIRYGRVKDAKLITAMKLADALDCSLDELVGREEYSHSEQALIHTFRQLNPGSQEFVLSVCDFESCLAVEYIDNSPIKRDITVFTPTGHMEDGMIYDSCSFTQLDIRDYIDRYGEDNIQCGLYITSDDFRPVYNKGDVLLICTKPPHPGDTAIILHQATGRLYIRKFYPGTTLTLESVNGFGRTIYVNGASLEELDQWVVMGVVLTRFRESNMTLIPYKEPMASGF